MIIDLKKKEAKERIRNKLLKKKRGKREKDDGLRACERESYLSAQRTSVLQGDGYAGGAGNDVDFSQTRLEGGEETIGQSPGHDFRDDDLPEYGDEGNFAQDDEAMLGEMVQNIGIPQGLEVNEGLATAKQRIEHGMITHGTQLTIPGLDLQDLNFLAKHRWNTLEEINVSRNMLGNIDCLAYYPGLKSIDASNNYIREIVLPLRKLRTLNLQNNFIEKFPVLEAKHLKVLNLNSNKLTNMDEVDPSTTPKLKSLDIGDNLIDLQDKKALDQYLVLLQGWPELRQLTVAGNTFMTPESELQSSGPYPIKVKAVLVQQMFKLETLDGSPIDMVKAELEEEEEAERLADQSDNAIFLKTTEPAAVETNTAEEKQKRALLGKAKAQWGEFKDFGGMKKRGQIKANMRKPLPTLSDYLRYLEAANGHPSRALEHLKDFADLVADFEKQQPPYTDDEIEEQFAPGMEESQVQEAIQQFMQNTQLLIDNQEELQGIMLSILGKLSRIKFQDFGLYCFETLTVLMLSGREMEDQVERVLNVEIIPKLFEKDPKVIPVMLLKGLVHLIGETQNVAILGQLYDFFPVWIYDYCEQLELCHRKGEVMGDDDHYDSIIQLMASSVNDLDNVQLVLDNQDSLLPNICILVAHTGERHARYIPILELISTLANAEVEIADIFLQRLVHKNLGETILKYLQIYKRNNSLIDEFSPETFEQQLNKYKTFAAQIKALGGLLNSSDGDEAILGTEPYKTVVSDLISFTSHPFTDPVLLTAVCQLCYDVFEHEDVKDDPEKMEPFFIRMDYMRELMPYLGDPSKYPDLLKAADKYNSIGRKEVNKDGEQKQSGGGFATEDLIADDDGTVVDRELIDMRRKNAIVQSMSNLDDPIVCELLEKIIRLIGLFQAEAQPKIGKTPNPLFVEMAEALDNLSREDSLFRSLNVPNDDVRLAVVDALFVVPVDQFDPDEINLIVTAMQSCKTLGAGRTELVLARLFHICTLFVQKSTESQSVAAFQKQYGARVVDSALDILRRNLENELDAELDYDDDMQKFALSLAAVNFIKSATHAPIMQSYLAGRNKVFKEILINEDLYSSQRACLVPCDVETSLLGREIPALIDCCVGSETVQPYGDVALRVIMRIADLLMGKTHCFPKPLEELDDEMSIEDELIQDQTRQYLHRKEIEFNFWADKPRNFFGMLDESQIAHLRRQHTFFEDVGGITLLRMFLTSKNPANEDMLRSVIDPTFADENEFDDEDNKHGRVPLATVMHEKLVSLEEKFMTHYQNSDEGNLFAFRKYRYKKANSGTQAGQDGVRIDDEPEEEDDEEPNPAFDNTLYVQEYKFVQNNQFENVGEDYDDFIKMQASAAVDKTQLENQLQEKFEADLRRRPREMWTMKERRGDGVQNQELRALTVAAYLRCLYAALEYAPTKNLRQMSIEVIRDPTMFRGITQLCDSTDWSEIANIGPKYLRVMRTILKMPLDKDQESTDMLVHYELTSIALQRALNRILDKMKKDISLTQGDKVCTYEVALTLFMIVKQTNYFVFSELDLVRALRQSELRIAKLALQQARITTAQINATKSSWQDDLDITEARLRTRMKCSHQEVVVKGGVEEDERSVVKESDMRQKRSVQQKMVEFFITQLFSKTCIFSLIEILFNDMQEDAAKYAEARAFAEETARRDAMPPPPEEEKKAEEEAAPEQNADEPDEMEAPKDQENDEIYQDADCKIPGYGDDGMHGYDVQEYLDLKALLTIERVKEIIGEILSTCEKQFEYQMIEFVMKKVLFENQLLRDSFLQEILDAAKISDYRVALQIYLNANKLTIAHLTPVCDEIEATVTYEADGDSKNRLERIIELGDVDLHVKQLSDTEQQTHLPRQENLQPENCAVFVKRLFVLTNEGIHVMKYIKPDLRCQDCAPHVFCPRGPTHDFIIRYEQIRTIVGFAQQPQKFVIFFFAPKVSNDPQEQNEDIFVSMQMTVIVKTYTRAARFFQGVQQALEIVNEKRQERLKELEEEGKIVQKQASFIYDDYYLDKLVQFELKRLLKLVSEELPEDAATSVELTYASVDKVELVSPTFRSLYYGEGVRRANRTAQHNDFLGISSGSHETHDFQVRKYQVGEDLTECSLFETSDRDPDADMDSVLVAFVEGFILVIKEHWTYWRFLRTRDEMITYKKERDRHEVEYAQYAQQDQTEFIGPWRRPLRNVDAMAPENDRQETWMERLLEINQNAKGTPLFELLAVIELNDVSRMNTHAGPQPSIELQIDEDEEAEDGSGYPFQSIVICFPGDMEREAFVGPVWDTIAPEMDPDNEGEEENKEEKKDKKKEEESDDDSDGGQQAFEDEIVPDNPPIYD